MMAKRVLAAAVILFVFFFSVACTSTDFKRIHKEVVEVEEKNVNAETLPIKSIAEENTEDETLLSLTPLYENGTVVASSEEKSSVDSAPGIEETFTFERVYDKESSNEKAGEIRAVEEKESLPSFVLVLAAVCALLVVIIVLGVVILVKRKKKTDRPYSSSSVQSRASGDEEYRGYISELIEDDDEEKTEEKDEKNTVRDVDIDEIIDIIK